MYLLHHYEEQSYQISPWYNFKWQSLRVFFWRVLPRPEQEQLDEYWVATWDQFPIKKQKKTQLSNDDKFYSIFKLQSWDEASTVYNFQYPKKHLFHSLHRPDWPLIATSQALHKTRNEWSKILTGRSVDSFVHLTISSFANRRDNFEVIKWTLCVIAVSNGIGLLHSELLSETTTWPIEQTSVVDPDLDQ